MGSSAKTVEVDLESAGDVHVGRRVHALVFDEPSKVLAGVRELRREGFDVLDVQSPFPIHGIEEALGLPETRLAGATLIGGIVGGTLAIAFQIWTHAFDWPLVIGGKSNLAIPALIPVTFELTVLFAAFATVGTLFWRRRLVPRFVSERAEGQADIRVNDDRFVILVVERDGSFSPARFRQIAESVSADETVIGWRVR